MPSALPEPLRTAFVTGASGQDGSYLCEQLLAEGVTVHALRHSASSPPVGNRAGESPHWAERVHWHDGDLSDTVATGRLIAALAPDEIINLAGVTSVAQSWDEPISTAQVTGIGAVGLMEAAYRLQTDTGRSVRMVQASSAEMYGTPTQSPQTEDTAIAPCSPYGAAKAYAHVMAGIYRSRGLGVSACVLYNHESPRRPLSFVTRKITRTVAEISLGLTDSLSLGNLDARRDWGWAPDYVQAMLLALRTDEPADFIIATGQAHSVADFVAAAFGCVGITDYHDLVLVDPAFVRPADPAELCGDPSRAERVLGWRRTVDFDGVVSRMVQADLAELAAMTDLKAQRR